MCLTDVPSVCNATCNAAAPVGGCLPPGRLALPGQHPFIHPPSRASILTGKHSVHNGFLDFYSTFDGAQPTVNKALGAAGYETALIGKWHLVTPPVGFDHWEILPNQGNYWNLDFIHIYSSDQGFYLGEHGWYDKRWMFEESLVMPFILRWPGVVKPGIRPEALIQNIDYAPTFLDAAGLQIPGDIQGRRLLPILRNEGRTPEDWRDAIYYFYTGENFHSVPAHDGIRTARHKIFHLPRTGEWQLFDLVADPREERSVHADPAYADVFAEMKTRYRELRRHYQIPEGLPK